MSEVVEKGRTRKSAPHKRTGTFTIKKKSRGKTTSGKPKVVVSRSDRDFYQTIYLSSPTERISRIQKGIPAKRTKMILNDMGIDQKSFLEAIGLKTATINKKVKEDATLAIDEGERLLGVAKLIGQVESMISESGTTKGFDAPSWIARWLKEPLPALGGRKPIEFLDTMEGQGLVADALLQIQHGSYA